MRTICRAIKLNPSTYYAARKTKLSKRALENQVLRIAILNIYLTAKKRFGAYKINNKLREQGLFISIGKCYRLLASMDLPTIYTQKPTFKRNIASNDLECPDLIKRNFKADIAFGFMQCPIFCTPVGQCPDYQYLTTGKIVSDICIVRGGLLCSHDKVAGCDF